MKSFISLEEAIDILNDNVETLEIEEVSLVEAIGRRIAEDIYSNMDNPPFNKSAMDGYAIKVENLNSSSEKLEVIDTVFAGHVSDKCVVHGTAMKIMTGARIPQGANAVVKQEDITLQGNFIILNKTVKENENVCFRGEDVKAGLVLVNKRKKINYADLGILASCGVNSVKVYKKPKVALITTGDEVIDVDKELSGGKIYNSNKYTLLGRIAELGFEVNYIEHENDSFEEIGNKIRKASEVADFILTTGGVSVGEKDLLDEAIKYIDGEILFWKVLIKPGSAVLCSKVNSKLVVSLSGNPTAALTTFELIGKTSLEKLSGRGSIEIKREKAVLTNSFTKPSSQRRFLRGMVSADEEGQKVTITQVNSGNGILSSALNSNCLIEINKGNNGVNSGEVIEIIKLNHID